MRVRFWVKNSLIAIGLITLLVPVYMILFESTGDEFVWEDIFVTASSYLWFIGAVFSMVFGASLYKQYLPIALSFGSTRREALVGIQLFRLIPMGIITALSLVLAFLQGREFFRDMIAMLPTSIGMYLIANSVGTVIGTAVAKFGNKALALLIPALIGLSVGVFFFVFSSLEEPGFIVEFAMGDGLQWVVLAAGLIVHGLSMIPEVKTVYHCNVKL